ncbi:exocyst complex subunit Sec15-like-domain-containing protein [Lipomyces chichibuensis]|uniref:exocyst complex subunit Sec15-like-domain-containing protein n=1 Tax=Lipomyces chichibuensis TaxID=1546026 RepID=UPI003343B9AF
MSLTTSATLTISPPAVAAVGGTTVTERTQAMMQHLQQVLLLSSDPISLLNSFEGDDYLEQLAPVVEEAVNASQVDLLIDRLASITALKEIEVQKLCNSNQHEYTKAVQQLAKVKQSSEQMRASVLNINQNLQQSGRALVARNKMLLDSQGARKNIDDATSALRQCLKVINMTNKIHEMIEQKKYFGALKSLDDLEQNHIQEVAQFEFAQMIRKSVPVMQATIKDDVIADLQVWLASVRMVAPQIGQIAFGVTESRRRRWKKEVDHNPQLRFYKLNSAVELAMDDDHDEVDPLNNDTINVDLTPFYESMHICSALGVLDEFRDNYALGRIKEQDAILPKSLEFTDDDIAPLESLLHGACGFAIIERVTVRKAYRVRTPASVNELWESMCQRIAHLIDPVLPTLRNPETLLQVRTLLGLFIQTMESYEFSVARLHSYMLTLFENYSAFLKQRFAEEFQQTVMEDDYMPMKINQRDLWEKIISISWYKPGKEASKVKFPCLLPFSQVYPLSCAEIRNFVNQHYQFSDEFSEQNPGQIEATLRANLDELLVKVVCKTLRDRLRSSNREEIVQIFINLEYFEIAAVELEKMLNETATVHLDERIKLHAAVAFSDARKLAETRIFELVNSKIDDFLEIADYDWDINTERTAPSSYLSDMVNFLETLVDSTLVNLPRSITSFIYFDAFDHLATKLLDLLLNAGRRISKAAVLNFNRDICYLENFVGNIGSSSSKRRDVSLNPGALDNSKNVKHRSEEDADNSLLTTFTELRQTIDLLLSPNVEEYNNTEIRMRKYGRVKPQNAAALVEKIFAPPATPSRTMKRFRRGG